jgi:hypothetical protein
VSPRGGGRAARLLLAMAAALVLLVPATPARAASFSFSFSAAAATSAFNQGVDFSVSLTADVAPASVEIHILLPGDTGPYVATLAATPRAGTSTLRYTLDTSGGGHLMPNTPITVTWVAYPQGGAAPVSSSPFTYRYSDETQHWHSLRDGIVTVHWTQGSSAFAQTAASVAVKAITTDAALLGIQETEPIDFFIYADDASFRAALGPGARENVGGQAVTEIRTLFAEFTPDMLTDAWVGITITHELTHQVVDDAVNNPYRSLPRWLNEGFAVYQSEGNAPKYRSQVSAAVSSGDLLPLTALGWQFPTDPTKTVLAYAESVSAVDYVVRQYGKDALVKLILAYRNGPTDDEALQAATGQDMTSFQTAWYASIGASAPTPFGPQPAPSGPLPSGWTGAATSPVPAASSAPGSSSAASPAATAPSPVPAASAAPADSGAGSGSSLTVILIGVMLVAGAVLVGILLANRRTGPS